MADLDSVVKEFLVESYENLDQLDRDLVVLEQEPRNGERLASVFRTVHTIKGTCGFFGFHRLESVTHVGENLLCRVRDGELLLNPELTTALLGLVDAIRSMLACIELTGTDGDQDYQELRATLSRLTGLPASTADVSAVTPPPTPPAANDTPAAPADPVAVTPDEGRVTGIADTNIRVDVGHLDKLMTLVGELVLARNQILQFAAGLKDQAFLGTSQRLNLITTELQEGVMKTRMQPIGNVWNRFPRVVRDLATQCGKQVRVEMEGKETELDKTIIEAIKDPLTHIVRNSVDHGIEPPEVRRACGKPPEGRLGLKAYHGGGQVNIEVSDDGRGIDPERVRAKAVERGLVPREQAARMTDREVVQLIFLPGFSTAEKVTNVSGRGVGMDVVKTNIEKIGGAIDVQSVAGSGTSLKIKIPLTLAIIPALIVSTGGERFAIPQSSLIELVRLEGDQRRRGIERIHGSPVYRLRGRLLPLLYLNRELHLPPPADLDALNIIVLQADDRQFGLVVESVSDTEEIVVKPLAKQFKGLPVFAGATILGDGQVSLILDVMGIAHRGGVLTEGRTRGRVDPPGPPDAAGKSVHPLLLIGMGENRRCALPLSHVARLEEIPAGAVEWADGQAVVQYRGKILPVFHLADLIGGSRRLEAEHLRLVVLEYDGRRVGVVVDEVLDIVDATLDVARPGGRTGVHGSAVIQGRVTDLLDLHSVLHPASGA